MIKWLDFVCQCDILDTANGGTLPLTKFDKEKHMGRLVEFTLWRKDLHHDILVPGSTSTTFNKADAHKKMMQHIRDGEKIQAIKQHRIITGLGLKDSKDAVDAVWGTGRSPCSPPLEVGAQGLILLERGRDVLKRVDTYLVHWNETGEQMVMFEGEVTLVEG